MNSFQHDTRVLKCCRVAMESDPASRVLVAALGDHDLPVEERTSGDCTVWRPRLRTRRWPGKLLVQLLKYLEWLARIVSRARSERPDTIHAHGLSALPAGVVARWMTGAVLVYDAHELETEVAGAGRFKKRLARWTERLLIRYVDNMVTVCDSIAKWYVDTYAVDEPFVVRNVPVWDAAEISASTILRDLHGIPDNALIFLYQGALSPGRGIEPLLSQSETLGAARHLVFMGYGILESRIQAAATRSNNVHFQRAVPPDDVAHYTSSADVGICLIEPVCLSYYLSLPNKLFEYLKSGIPILVNDLPEQRMIVDEYDCGWTAPDMRNGLGELLRCIDHRGVAQKNEGVMAANRDFSWQAEAASLKAAYAAAVSARISPAQAGSA